jgi:Zn finger protein HypA/HybF involved in hydrogenase expression
MKNKKIPDIEFKCRDCGYVPEPNKKQSNKNWKVIDAICPKCGGRVIPEVKV